MAKQVLLDAGPLSMITHPRPKAEIVTWLKKPGFLRRGN
jgi:hypothetical protein